MRRRFSENVHKVAQIFARSNRAQNLRLLTSSPIKCFKRHHSEDKTEFDGLSSQVNAN